MHPERLTAFLNYTLNQCAIDYNFMAYTLKFLSTEESGLETELEVFINSMGFLTLKIEGDGLQLICLEKESAIKLAKEIRKQISFLED